eukprot:3263328-Rhodomonas_salina.1
MTVIKVGTRNSLTMTLANLRPSSSNLKPMAAACDPFRSRGIFQQGQESAGYPSTTTTLVVGL